MEYISTRGDKAVLDFEGVTLAGLAPDGGLYVPREWPRFTQAEIAAMLEAEKDTAEKLLEAVAEIEELIAGEKDVIEATEQLKIAEELPRLVAVLATFITAGAGLLMVSNFRYHSFKKLDLRRRVPFVIMLLVVLVVGVVTVDPPRILLLVAVVYALSGPGQLAVRRLRARRAAP